DSVAAAHAVTDRHADILERVDILALVVSREARKLPLAAGLILPLKLSGFRNAPGKDALDFQVAADGDLNVAGLHLDARVGGVPPRDRRALESGRAAGKEQREQRNSHRARAEKERARN